jgi:hypothetical protein
MAAAVVPSLELFWAFGLACNNGGEAAHFCAIGVVGLPASGPIAAIGKFKGAGCAVNVVWLANLGTPPACPLLKLSNAADAVIILSKLCSCEIRFCVPAVNVLWL